MSLILCSIKTCCFLYSFDKRPYLEKTKQYFYYINLSSQRRSLILIGIFIACTSLKLVVHISCSKPWAPRSAFGVPRSLTCSKKHILTPKIFIVSAVCCPRRPETYKLQIFICSPPLTKCVRVYLDRPSRDPDGGPAEPGTGSPPGTPSIHLLPKLETWTSITRQLRAVSFSGHPFKMLILGQWFWKRCKLTEFTLLPAGHFKGRQRRLFPESESESESTGGWWLVAGGWHRPDGPNKVRTGMWMRNGLATGAARFPVECRAERKTIVVYFLCGSLRLQIKRRPQQLY